MPKLSKHRWYVERVVDSTRDDKKHVHFCCTRCGSQFQIIRKVGHVNDPVSRKDERAVDQIYEVGPDCNLEMVKRIQES